MLDADRQPVLRIALEGGAVVPPAEMTADLSSTASLSASFTFLARSTLDAPAALSSASDTSVPSRAAMSAAVSSPIPSSGLSAPSGLSAGLTLKQATFASSFSVPSGAGVTGSSPRRRSALLLAIQLYRDA